MDKKLVLKYCLQNAVFYMGKADPKAVLGKVLSAEPGLRNRAEEVRRLVEKTAADVNRLSPGEQKKKLEGLAPELLERVEKRQEELPELRDAKMGKVVTRFAPCPSGPLNLFQVLRAVMISYMYARRYRGRFILRFEDTDPRKVKKEFYGWIREDLKNLGVKCDEVITESEHMGVYYRYCEKLLKEGKFYACTCPARRFRDLKLSETECPCRKRKSKENVSLWRRALGGRFREGKIVIRHRTSMKDPNPAFRDPPMFRVIDSGHPMLRTRYYMWPLYNFANVIEDHEAGVTHVFRGKEHIHNEGIQNRVYSDLGWRPPYVLSFGMIYLEGEKVHTRDIKERIERGELSGWDDPRLHTVRALLRRGFQPEAFRRFAVDVGLTKTDIRIRMENLEGINGKLIDPLANRFFAVIDPVKISLDGIPKTKGVELPRHPDFPERGSRRIPVDTGRLWVSGEDWKLKKGEFRLIGLGNFRVKRGKAVYTGNQIIRTMKKMQWVSGQGVKVKIARPEGVVSGIGEPSMGKLRPGEVIQMERIGFGRVDSKTKSSIMIYFAHR